MTGDREKDLLAAADLLMNARRTGQRIHDLPEHLRPVDMTESEFIQDSMASAYGEIGGYKIGASTPDAVPTFAPMPAAWFAPSGALLSEHSWYRIVEAEIAFLIREDLPPRAVPYTREEVLGAMASCHPVIEVLETAYLDAASLPAPTMHADLQRNGGFVYGPAFADWRTTDFSQEKVTLAIDGSVRVERTGSNTSGDFFRLLVFLANEGASRTGGLKRGQWITTGSWVGNPQASAGSTVDVIFSTAGRVELRFA